MITHVASLSHIGLVVVTFVPMSTFNPKVPRTRAINVVWGLILAKLPSPALSALLALPHSHQPSLDQTTASRSASLDPTAQTTAQARALRVPRTHTVANGSRLPVERVLQDLQLIQLVRPFARLSAALALTHNIGTVLGHVPPVPLANTIISRDRLPA